MQLTMQVLHRMKVISDFVDGSTGDMKDILFCTILVITQCTNLLDIEVQKLTRAHHLLGWLLL